MSIVKKAISPIKPTLRGKKRYVLFELISNEKIAEYDVKNELNRVFMRLFGEFGVAERRIWFIKFDEARKAGIARCGHKYAEDAKAAILFLKEVKGKAVIPRIKSVSGSVHKLKEKIG